MSPATVAALKTMPAAAQAELETLWKKAPSAPSSLIESAVFTEINLARSSPKEYAAKLAPILASFDASDSSIMRLPGRIPIKMQEGKSAVEEAIEFLKKTAPVAPLERVAPGLNAACADHAQDLMKSGATGHTGSDGSSPFDRMSRHGQWAVAAAENIAYYPETDHPAVDATVQLIIDDGVADRGHRKNIFNEALTCLGVAECAHPTFGRVLVTTFAASYSDGSSVAARPAAAGGLAADSIGKPQMASTASGAQTTSTASKTAVAPTTAAAPVASVDAKAGWSTKVEVQESVSIEGSKKTTTKTTVTTETDSAGNSKTSTMVETTVVMTG